MSHKKIFIFMLNGNEYFFWANSMWPNKYKKDTHEKDILYNCI